MKAFDICLLLMFINGGIFVASAFGIAPGSMGGIYGVENVPEGYGWTIPYGLGSMSLTDLGLIVTAIVIAGSASLYFRVTTPQVVGIVAFAAIFTALYAQTSNILSMLYLPAEVILMFGATNMLFMVVAVIQLATSSSMKMME